MGRKGKGKGKHFAPKNYTKSAPKTSSDEENSDTEEKLSRDLKHGRYGAAYIHPSRLQRLQTLLNTPPRNVTLAQETPVHQSSKISSSADATNFVAESPCADDE